MLLRHVEALTGWSFVVDMFCDALPSDFIKLSLCRI